MQIPSAHARRDAPHLRYIRLTHARAARHVNAAALITPIAFIPAVPRPRSSPLCPPRRTNVSRTLQSRAHPKRARAARSRRVLLTEAAEDVPLGGDSVLVEQPLLHVLEVRRREPLRVELAVLDRVDRALRRAAGVQHGERRLAEDDARGDEVDRDAPVLARRERLDEILDGQLELPWRDAREGRQHACA